MYIILAHCIVQQISILQSLLRHTQQLNELVNRPLEPCWNQGPRRYKSQELAELVMREKGCKAPEIQHLTRVMFESGTIIIHALGEVTDPGTH